MSRHYDHQHSDVTITPTIHSKIIHFFYVLVKHVLYVKYHAVLYTRGHNKLAVKITLKNKQDQFML
jgi:hypothetical protein